MKSIGDEGGCDGLSTVVPTKQEAFRFSGEIIGPWITKAGIDDACLVRSVECSTWTGWKDSDAWRWK